MTDSLTGGEALDGLNRLLAVTEERDSEQGRTAGFLLWTI